MSVVAVPMKVSESIAAPQAQHAHGRGSTSLARACLLSRGRRRQGPVGGGCLPTGSGANLGCRPTSVPPPPLQPSRSGDPSSCAAAAYASSVTGSSQWTTSCWSSPSLMARWTMSRLAVAPCQCSSSASNRTRSPGRMSSIAPPRRWQRPTPSVTNTVWLSGCRCQWVRAPGMKCTRLAVTRDGGGAAATESMNTSPVNQSPGPLAVSMELRVICMGFSPMCGLIGGARRRLRRRPGGEQAEPFCGRRPRFGGIDHEHQPRLGGDRKLLVGERQLAYDGVLEALAAGAVGADVVVGPEPTEHVAAGGQLADQVLQGAVVRVSSGLGAHDAHAHLREQLPVGVEVVGGGVEELEPRQVWAPAAVADDG